MWNSEMLIDGGEDATVATSWLEASNLVVLKVFNPLQLCYFCCIFLRITPKLNCELLDCPIELLHPPEDCNVNSYAELRTSLLKVLFKGSVVHFHWARTISVQSSGIISASGMGCIGGVGRGNFLDNGIGSGGGHGGKGGFGCYNGSCVEGGISYGNSELPCELGSLSGNKSSADSTAGGGVIVMGSVEHPLSSLSVEGVVRADGESFEKTVWQHKYSVSNDSSIAPGGGSGGTVLLFLRTLTLGESAILSSVGGYGSPKGGGGGGGEGFIFIGQTFPLEICTSQLLV
ncbi:hypothetical protein CRYUN_Cryun02cG0044600 [Craigia yunnanensis]